MLIYLLLINALGFVLMCTDKAKAKRKQWRIPEATLFTVALVGGSAGCLFGMYTVRHKTKHMSFVIGLPLILCLQIVAALYFYN